MKYLLELLWLFIPRETPGAGDGGDPAGDPDPAAAGGDPPDPTDPPKPIGGSDPEGKPDWLADKFWNPDLKAPRTEVLAKSFNELEGKLRTKTDDLKAEVLADLRAQAPEKYEIRLPEDLELPDNIEFDLTDEDPLVGWFSGFAKDIGLNQEQFDKALQEYINIEISNVPDMNKEIEKLGDHGQDRLLRVHNWLETKLSEDELHAMSGLLNSAEQIAALEKLMKQSGPSDFDGDGDEEKLTLEELRAMQNDKRYWQDKDPAFIKKVELGYQRLYKNA